MNDTTANEADHLLEAIVDTLARRAALGGNRHEHDQEAADLAEEALDAFEALDRLLRDGGRPPAPWLHGDGRWGPDPMVSAPSADTYDDGRETTEAKVTISLEEYQRLAGIAYFWADGHKAIRLSYAASTAVDESFDQRELLKMAEASRNAAEFWYGGRVDGEKVVRGRSPAQRFEFRRNRW